MAADTRPARRRAKRIAIGLAALVLAAMLGFALSAWIGSSIARNGDWSEPAPGAEPSIPILVGSNGIHTEIAMPVRAEGVDWHRHFPPADIAASARPYTHVAVSWGERAFFLETPTWADLDPVTAISAAIGGKGVLHVAHYVRPAPSQDYRVLHLRPREFRALADAIIAALDPPAARETLQGYGAHDVFYSARGTYHLGNTCNQWTADRLADAGVATGLWTPLPGGVMKWVPER
ncbi:TIGR02117 family protein [Qipengyuania nanhaisediminis]|uniref:TIGR02117 family protein n=1 Tax=Qipengyuania nanhaisediminis TaxID=604088 RepID=UPI0038B3243D